MDGAGAAECHAAAEFRAGQTELVAQKPQERHRRIAVERALLSIHFYGDHEFLRWRVSGATELPPLSAWRCLELAASRRSAPHAVSEAGGSLLLAVSLTLERVRRRRDIAKSRGANPIKL